MIHLRLLKIKKIEAFKEGQKNKLKKPKNTSEKGKD
jgi:hypothetical protein